MAITVETVDGRIRVLTLDRPEVLNATRLADLEELDARLLEAEHDSDVRCLVLTGAGSAFCAGHDIHEMDGLDAAALADLDRRRHGPTWHWATSDLPTIAAVNGVCYGFGAILAASADLRVGGPTSRIKVTAVTYGGANLTWILPALIGESHARDLILTGRAVDGAEAYRIGLLNRYADDGDVLGTALWRWPPSWPRIRPRDRARPSACSTRVRASAPGALRARARAPGAVAARRRRARHLRRVPRPIRRAPCGPRVSGALAVPSRRHRAEGSASDEAQSSEPKAQRTASETIKGRRPRRW